MNKCKIFERCFYVILEGRADGTQHDQNDQYLFFSQGDVYIFTVFSFFQREQENRIGQVVFVLPISKGLMTGRHFFCLFFIFYNIHIYIHSFNHIPSIQFILRHSLRPLSISSSLVCSLLNGGTPPCGAELRIELGPSRESNSDTTISRCGWFYADSPSNCREHKVNLLNQLYNKNTKIPTPDLAPAFLGRVAFALVSTSRKGGKDGQANFFCQSANRKSVNVKEKGSVSDPYPHWFSANITFYLCKYLLDCEMPCKSQN